MEGNPTTFGFVEKQGGGGFRHFLFSPQALGE